MSDYTVRELKIDEVAYCTSMGRRMHDESAFRNMNFDEQKVAKLLFMAITNKDFLFAHVIIHEPTEVPVGGLLAGLSQTYFGSDFVSNDLMLMVEREHRGRCFDAVMRLTALYREWGIERGAKRIYLGTSTGIEPETTRRVLEACGFKQIGTLHEA